MRAGRCLIGDEQRRGNDDIAELDEENEQRDEGHIPGEDHPSMAVRVGQAPAQSVLTTPAANMMDRAALPSWRTAGRWIQ
ncbi:MAG: hypothetical protein IPI61_12290 [Syntrophaceae bacterium]|nr:hypothetical protein [Syntrophaceae bacterium]